MRYLWVFIVLSAGQAFGQNAYGPDFLNLHCTAPDPLAQVLFNIQPRPGLVPDHSANGNVVLYCDAGSGAMKVSYNGGAYGFLGSLATAFDVRASASSFDCTGTNAMDTGMQSIPSTAHIIVPFGCVIKLANSHTYPQTFEINQGGRLAPTTGTLITLTGPIIAGSYQIFNNALVAQGGIDFTGNTNQFDVLPEWWGATAGGTASTNTTAMQAAFYGAFGCNTSPVTSCRTNASGLTIYNRRLKLTGIYQINAQLKFYHVIGFVIDCSSGGRITAGIQQTGTNQKILDGQSDAYGAFINCAWTSTASQDINHPLIDLNYDTSQGTDLATQFIDFYHNSWIGTGVTSIGFRVAAAGAGAQGSNISFYDNAASGFTEAAYMVGAGSGCTPTAVATNAIGINWFGGDIQTSPAFGIENHGGTQLHYIDGTMENGGFINLGNTAQTGADFCANSMNSAGGPFVVENFRSESAYLFATGGGGGANFSASNVTSIDNAFVPDPGNGGSLNELIEGDSSCGHGYWEKITTAGTFSGLGSRATPLSASAGTTTSITDSVGGFTVNAWTGWSVCIVSGTGSGSSPGTAAEYCVITSNTASTFTCTGGFQSDFLAANAATIIAPDNTTKYRIEPNWGTQTTSGTVTFALDNTAYPGLFNVNGAFFPGKRVTPVNDVNNFNMVVTRTDWDAGPFADNVIYLGLNNVTVGSPQVTGSGVGGINGSFIRNGFLPRNSLTELTFPQRVDVGARVYHWFTGQVGGGVATSDVYLGTDSNLPATKQGDLFITNNSSNTAKKWTFNFDGTASFPAALTSTGSAAALTGTGACLTQSTQAGGNFAGNVTCTGATAASTLIITPGTTAPHGLSCFASDVTHTLAGSQSAVSTTACTMTFTSVTANDVLTFGVLAY